MVVTESEDSSVMTIGSKVVVLKSTSCISALVVVSGSTILIVVFSSSSLDKGRIIGIVCFIVVDSGKDFSVVVVSNSSRVTPVVVVGISTKISLLCQN